MPRPHNRRIWFIWCETNSTVRPWWLTSSILPRHFFWNAISPTASTSSTEQDLRFEVRSDREREPHLHAARVVLDRRVDERVDVGERHDLVELPGNFRPPHPEDRAVDEDVFPSGQFRMEAGPHLEQRADAAAHQGLARASVR